jgi:hypothetical protein
VNLALAAVDHFNRFLGLGPAIVSREPLAQTAPRALSEDDQRALVRAAEASKPRDCAIVVLLLYMIAAKTGFIEASTSDQEPGAKLAGLATSLCAVLVAQACNVGYKPVVDESNPALREARLRYVAQRYLRPETIAAANALIVHVHAKLPLAERWGRRRGRIDRRAAIHRAQAHDSRRHRPAHRR